MPEINDRVVVVVLMRDFPLPNSPLLPLQANGFSALHWAVVRGNADTTIDLVDAGAAVNTGCDGCSLEAS